MRLVYCPVFVSEKEAGYLLESLPERLTSASCGYGRALGS